MCVRQNYAYNPQLVCLLTPDLWYSLPEIVCMFENIIYMVLQLDDIYVITTANILIGKFDFYNE